MKKKRFIAVLLLKNGWIVQSQAFQTHRNLGNPVTSVKRLSEWACDELIYLDISREPVYDLRREDLNHPNRNNILQIIEDVSKVTFMPVTFGGGIRTLHDIEERLSRGADKVAINSKPLANPEFLTEAAKEFGSQCIVVSMDVKTVNGNPRVLSQCGRFETEYTPVDWARRAEELGAGEILLNSIDRDGSKQGYDIPLIKSVAESVKIPVIACGGVGEWAHLAEALEATKVDAIAAANILHYRDQSVYLAKKFLFENGYPVRPPDLMSS